jgi:thiol-disulfide isomerase/thioredoxin
MPQAEYQAYLAFGKTIECEELRTIFMNRLERNSRFAVGNPATDIAVIDLQGLEKQLSDFKGNVLYVDIWATWCAPCRRESPFFKAHSERFENIKFIAISVDDKKETVENYAKNRELGNVIHLWSSDPGMRRNWDISGIPRFLLIDENFRIISANAPRPSDVDTIIPLLEKYNR